MSPEIFFGTKLPELIEQHTDRTATLHTHLLSPMATALEAGFGAEAQVVVEQLANTFAGTELYPSVQVLSNKNLLLSVKSLIQTPSTGSESSKIRFGAALLLGSIAVTYHPQTAPATHYSRRADACAAVAYELLANYKNAQYSDLTDTLLATSYDIAHTQQLRDELSTLFADISDILNAKSNDLRPAVVPERTVESREGVPFARPDVRELLSQKRVASALPWLKLPTEDAMLPSAAPLYDEGTLAAWTVDVSGLNPLSAKITEEACQNSTIDVQKFQQVGYKRFLHDKLQRSVMRNDITHHKSYGSNAKLLRSYYFRAEDFDNLPVLFHLGTSRTKANQGRLITLINNTGSVVRKKNIGS
jgi:hypothetical protein